MVRSAHSSENCRGPASRLQRRLVIALSGWSAKWHDQGGAAEGAALAIYGIPRATIDIDMLIMPDQVPSAEEVLGQLG